MLLVIVEEGPPSLGAYVPDLQWCVVAAEIRDEAMSLIREAIEFHIEGLKQSRQATRAVSLAAVATLAILNLLDA